MNHFEFGSHFGPTMTKWLTWKCGWRAECQGERECLLHFVIFFLFLATTRASELAFVLWARVLFWQTIDGGRVVVVVVVNRHRCRAYYKTHLTPQSVCVYVLPVLDQTQQIGFGNVAHTHTHTQWEMTVLGPLGLVCPCCVLCQHSRSFVSSTKLISLCRCG